MSELECRISFAFCQKTFDSNLGHNHSSALDTNLEDHDDHRDYHHAHHDDHDDDHDDHYGNLHVHFNYTSGDKFNLSKWCRQINPEKSPTP